MERYEEWMSDSGKWKDNLPSKTNFPFFRWYMLRKSSEFKDSPREQFTDFMSAIIFQKETGWN